MQINRFIQVVSKSLGDKNLWKIKNHWKSNEKSMKFHWFFSDFWPFIDFSQILVWLVLGCVIFYEKYEKYLLGRGVNREGFNFKLAMVKTCSTWPLLNKYALKKIWSGSSDPTFTSDPLYSLWKRQKLNIWILFLQRLKCITINLTEILKTFNGKFEGF